MKMKATGFHYTNTTTHYIVGFDRNWNTVFGVFAAKGHYVEIIAFGKVFRIAG